MAAVTPQEQLMLELVNRARLNPAQEAARYGLALSAGQKAPRDALAMNADLYEAATNHTAWMLRYDIFSHDETVGVAPWKTGTTPQQRANFAGYVGSVGENIAWTGSSATPNPTASILELHKGLFLSAGHRANILNAFYDEIGIDQTAGKFLSGGTNWNASMVTQVFGNLNAERVFVTGVVYNDTRTNDNFYTVGEQRANFSITSTAPLEKTGAGGGYEIAFAPGAGVKTISFGAVKVSVTVASLNVKVDFVNGREIWTDSNLTAVSTNVAEMHAIGSKAVALTGAAGNEKIFGNAAGNNLRGNGGNDQLNGGLGSDRLSGGPGADTFIFNSKLSGSANRDTVLDFVAADDVIHLDNAIFAKLGAVGALKPAFFKAGPRALDANDYIIYNRGSGALFYDADGSGAGAAIPFATLTTEPVITAADFRVI